MSMVGAKKQPLASEIATMAFILLYFIPLLYIGVTSIKPVDEIFKNAASLWFRPDFSAYAQVWDGRLIRAAWNSLVVSLGTTTITITFGALAAFALARAKSARFVDAALLLLIVLQMVPQANAVIPLYRVLGQFGLLGSRAGVILALSAFIVPFAILMMRPFFANVPTSVLEFAEIEGANRWQIFWLVSLPLARNGIITVAVLVWIIGWGELLYSISFLSTTADLPLSALLGQQISQFGTDWGPLMALSLIALIPVLIVFFATRRLLAAGLTIGANR